MEQDKIYFHDIYFEKILKMAVSFEFDKAFYEFEKYLKNYPKDMYAYSCYIQTLIHANRIEKARELLEYTESMLNKHVSYLTMNMFTLVKLEFLCSTYQYEKAYNLYLENRDRLITNFNLYKNELFMKKKLELLTKDDFHPESYIANQIFAYSKERAIEHIKKHQQEESKERFAYDFNIESVYYYLRNILPLENKWLRNGMYNFYLIKYPNVGYSNDKRVDFLEVVTLIDSNDIITMYPEIAKEGYYHFALEEREEALNLKRVSQIDKFNKKYNK